MVNSVCVCVCVTNENCCFTITVNQERLYRFTTLSKTKSINVRKHTFTLLQNLEHLAPFCIYILTDR